MPIKLITFFTTHGTEDEVMVLTCPIEMKTGTAESAFVPASAFVPGGNIDLTSEEDYAAVMRVVASCGGPDIVEYYPAVCEVHTETNPKTFFFFKLPKDTYERVKRTPVTLFAVECLFEDTAPIIALRVEFVNAQFKSDLYRQFAMLRQHIGKRVLFEPPEPVYAEGVMNPLSVREWRRMCELANQDIWLQVVAPADLSDVSFIETPVNPQSMTLAMERAKEHLERIEASQVNYHAAYEALKQSGSRPNLMIYGCFEDYKCGGKLLLDDGALFESELRKWVFDHLHIGKAFADWE